MIDEYSGRKRAFVSQVISIVHECHSHNIPATCKRLERIFQSFQAECIFNASTSVQLAMILDGLRTSLGRLRRIAPSDESGIESVKRECLSAAASLNLLVSEMEFRNFPMPEADNDISSDTNVQEMLSFSNRSVAG